MVLGMTSTRHIRRYWRHLFDTVVLECGRGLSGRETVTKGSALCALSVGHRGKGHIPPRLPVRAIVAF